MTTGKNKEQFEKWYLTLTRKERKDYIKFTDAQILRKFYRSIFEMQIGVYLAYYDSLGLDVDVRLSSEYFFRVWIGSNPKSVGEGFKTRNEAYQEAFKKADQLINKK